MNYFDLLPVEILHMIAADSEPAYLALITAYPRFAREVTPGQRIDYMVGFGHDVQVTRCDITWYKNNIIHRIDGPAIEYNCGVKEWYRDGLLHRKNGPALDCDTGVKAWYRDGVRHREDGPAVEYTNGTRQWYLNGVCTGNDDNRATTA